MGCLQRIYRIEQDLDKQGQAIARAALKEGYRKTQHSLLTNPKLGQFFDKGFIARLPDWDKLVRGYLEMNGDKSAAAV